MARRWAIFGPDGKTVHEIVAVDPEMPDHVAVEVTDRKIGPRWVHRGGAKFDPPDNDVPPPTQLEYQEIAATVLYQSDIVVLRCYEIGIPVPNDWQAYRRKLRAIIRNVGKNDTSKPMPEAPAAPKELP